MCNEFLSATIALLKLGPAHPIFAQAIDAVEGSRSRFTNVIWDSTVAGEDTIFESIFEWIGGGEFAGQCVTARTVHPAEANVYWHPTKDTVKLFYLRGLAQIFPVFTSLRGSGLGGFVSSCQPRRFSTD